MVEKFSCIVQEDRRVSIEELSTLDGISYGSMHIILHNNLGLSKRTCRWSLDQLDDTKKMSPVTACPTLLSHYPAAGHQFFSRVIIGEDSIVYFNEPR